MATVKAGIKRRRSGASVKSVKAENKINPGLLLKLVLVIGLLGCTYYLVISAPKVVESVNNQHVEQVIIEGDVRFVSEQEVLGAVNKFISESLLLVDMDEIKMELEKMPWMRSVVIRRDWPDTLVLNIVEEKAIARWGETSLLNQDGIIFSPENFKGLEQLAVLSGPEGSENLVMEQYLLFNQLLYQRGLKIEELILSERGSWKLKLANGVLVQVGKLQVMEKLRRLVEFSSPEFIERMVRIETIDLRYTSGIAVKNRIMTNEEVVSL